MPHFVTKSLFLALVLAPIACSKTDNADDVAIRIEVAKPVTRSERQEVQAVVDVADLPRRFLVETDLLEADIRIPDEVFVVAPILARRLVDEAEAALETAKQTAEAHRSLDPKTFHPHALRMSWQVTGAAGPLISLEQFVYDFSGGAHPSFATHGLIYSTERQEGLSLSDLLINPEGAVNAHMDSILDVLVVQKMAAGVSPGAEDMVRGELSDVVTADMILSSAVSLVDATAPGKFGGYVVHFAPYEIGSFAEGAYHVTIPQSDFKTHIRSHFSGLFEGVPIAIDRPDSQ